MTPERASPTRYAGLLESVAARVRCTDPNVTTDPSLVPLEDAVEWADILVIAAPHRAYSGLVTDKPVADIWNMLGHGTTV